LSAIAFNRLIGPVPLDVVVTESHETEIGITSNPIETGAEVNDHAYIMPKKVTLDIASSNGAATWAALVRFQETRIPFVLITGLSVYTNMLIKSLQADRDKDTSRILRGSVELQEVIIVGTSYAATSQGGITPSGQPGGTVSLLSARPDPSRSLDAITALRASGIVARGDSPVITAPLIGKGADAALNRSIVQGIFGK
jgi:hypothetical protein